MELRLKELRKTRGLTLDDLADMAGISKSYLSELENGRKDINGRRLKALAKALGVRPSDILGDSAGPEADELARIVAELPPADRQLLTQIARRLRDRGGPAPTS